MRLRNIFFLLLICFSSLEGRKKYKPKERVCTRVDAGYVYEVIPQTVESFHIFVDKVQQEVQELYNQLIAVPAEERTFHNTVRIYDTLYLKMWMGKQIAAALSHLHQDSDVRNQAGSAASALFNFEKKLYVSGLIEQALEEYKKHGSDTKYRREEVQDYIDIALQEHRKYDREKDGVDYLLNQFLYHSSKPFQTVTVDGADLSGLSEEYKDSLVGDDSGSYQIPLDFRSFFEVMETAESEELRKIFYRKFSKRGYPQNAQLIRDIVQKRNKFARESGYPSFVEYAITDHMLKDLKKVEEFLWNAVAKLQEQEYEMYEEMLDYQPDSVELSGQDKLKPWDETFLKAYFRRNVLGVEDYKISKYFPLKKTLPKVLHLYEQFFSVSFEKEDRYSWWSPDVSLYRVSDEQTKEILGYVFFHLLYRDGKFEEQKHITLVPGVRDDCNLPCLSVSVVVSDYHKPSRGDVHLALDNVRTLIHEIGHAVHACFGATKFAQLSGTQVARDFVEMPSQIFEFWLEDADILKSISSHYRTNNPLSDKNIDRIIEAEEYISVSQLLKQCFISLLMIEIYKQENKDPHDVAREVYQKVYPYLEYDPDYYIECNIDHFVSYGPSYYSYVWTKILAEDLFKKIEKKGILDRSVGRKFSKHILSPGGSGDYHSMIQTFVDSIA